MKFVNFSKGLVNPLNKNFKMNELKFVKNKKSENVSSF